MSWRGWGRAEIMILRQCAGTMTVEGIGRLIGRTGGAVRTKARQLHQCGVPRREIAEKLEMPLGMINQYVYFERRVHEV